MDSKKFNAIMGSMRVAIIVILIFCQAALMFILVNIVKNMSVYIYVIIDILIVATMLLLVSRNKNSCYTIAWILLIAIFPVLGFVLYLAWGRADTNSKQNKKVRKSIDYSKQFTIENRTEQETLLASCSDGKRIASYLSNNGFPIYQNTSCEYYPVGELQFEALLEDLRNAKYFIFIQPFILAEEKLWDQIESILIQKAAEKVEVRVLYDDLGGAATFTLKKIQGFK